MKPLSRSRHELLLLLNHSTIRAVLLGSGLLTLTLHAQTAQVLPGEETLGAPVRTDNGANSAVPLASGKERPVIGLALEGGGALGLAHIGVLQWLEDHRIPVDRLAGTSMGALIGSFYASGLSPEEIAQVAESGSFRDVFSLQASYDNLNFRRREDRRDLPQSVTLGLKHGPSLRNSLLDDQGLDAFLAERLAAYNRVSQSFDSLPIPFRCVATDLNTLSPVVFADGSVPEAVRASIAIPGVFAPLSYRGHYLVDGAIVDNLPTDVVRSDLKADVVIAVDLRTAPFAESDISSLVNVFARAYAAGTARNEQIGKRGADVLLETQTLAFSTSDYDKAPQLIAAGYRAAEEQQAQLVRFQLTPREWSRYIAERQSRVRPVPTTLETVEADGATSASQQSVAKALAPLIGQPISAPAIVSALRGVQGNGTVRAHFETFSTQAAGASAPALGDTAVLVHLEPSRSGPPFLLFGMDTTAVTGNVTRATFDFRVVDSDLGGSGSELRTDVRLGFLTQASAEYYRKLTTNGFFLKPSLGILRQPIYLWRHQQRISEHLEQQAGGGIAVGRTFSRFSQLSLEYTNQVVRWHPVSGSDETLPLSGGSQRATLSFQRDTERTGAFSTSGTRLSMRAGALFRTSQSDNAPFLEFRVDRGFALSERSFIYVSGSTQDYFRRSIPEALRFTVGGPLRLSAASVDEYRGTDVALGRFAFTRKLANLPSGYGQGLYASVGYEGGGVLAPERPAFSRQDGFLTLIGNTPVGVVTFGGSIGDAGHRKIFFTYGRLF